MKLLILGADGQLGRELARSFADHDIVGLSRRDCDICDDSAVLGRLEEARPAVVVNAAAFTRVDDCEDNVATAFAVNAAAVRTVAAACDALGAVLVHVSTDYVFRGDRRHPYDEDDSPSPVNVYGNSKAAGEFFVRAICPRHFIVRTSGLYGLPSPNGGTGNFVETMLALARAGKHIRVVSDQVVSPTYTRDLSQFIGRLIETDAYGVYHVTNSGECSWYQFAERVFALAEVSPDLTMTTAAEFGAKARRPYYSVLAHSRLTRLGFGEPRHWHEALVAYLRERVQTVREAMPC